MTRPFRFKQFNIKQEESPMKVGTDSVLLGAWCKGVKGENILDIGTGTGILSLMMAQRYPDSRITAIEVNAEAFEEAKFNIAWSPWSDRIELHHTDLSEYNPTEKFDLIIANPPFFHADLKSPETGKATARHAAHFNLNGFANSTSWLQPTGRLAGVYPVDIYPKFEREMVLLGFYPERIMKVHPTPEKPAHRILFEFTCGEKRNTAEESLVIESDGRHMYSEEYKKLTGEFYLNF